MKKLFLITLILLGSQLPLAATGAEGTDVLAPLFPHETHQSSMQDGAANPHDHWRCAGDNRCCQQDNICLMDLCCNKDNVGTKCCVS